MLSAAVLPYELHSMIAIYCSPATLARLALVHSAWTAPSESILYKDVSLKSLRPDKCVKFFDTLLHHPTKALRVRALDAGFAEPTFISVKLLGHYNVDKASKMLLAALPSMHKLVQLVLPRALSIGHAAFCCAALPLCSLVLTIDDPQSIPELTVTVLSHLQTLKILGLHLWRRMNIVTVDEFLRPLARRCRFFLTEPDGVHVIPHLFAQDTDWDSFFRDIHFACNWLSRPALHITSDLQSVKESAFRVAASFSRAFVDMHSKVKVVLQFITANRESIVVDYDALWGCVSPLAPNLFELDLRMLPHVEWESPFLQVNIAGLTRISVATRLERDGCSHLDHIEFPFASFSRDTSRSVRWALDWDDDRHYNGYSSESNSD